MTNYQLKELVKNKTVCIFGAGHLGKNVAPGLLGKLDISIDYYCDNNLSLVGNEIIAGVYCRSLDQIINDVDHIVVFLMLGCSYEADIKKQLTDIGVKDMVTYQDLIEASEFVYDIFPFIQETRIAVYTCIVGDYDKLHEPLVHSEKCDYYLVSDSKPPENSVYNYIDIRDVIPQNVEDNTRKNRYCKINAYKLFPQYKYSIYMDGTITLKKDISSYIEKMPKSRCIVSGRLYNDCLYREAARCILSKSDSSEKIVPQINKYWIEGMPKHFGEFWCNVLVREHNNPVCVKLMEDWWNEVYTFSKRDQISFPYCLWKNGLSAEDVGTILSGFETNNDYWIFDKSHR